MRNTRGTPAPREALQKSLFKELLREYNCGDVYFYLFPLTFLRDMTTTAGVTWQQRGRRRVILLAFPLGTSRPSPVLFKV